MYRLSLIICCFLMASILFMISHEMAAHRFLAGVLSGTGPSKGGVHRSPSGTAPSQGQMNPPPAVAHSSPTGSHKSLVYKALQKGPVCNEKVYANCVGAGRSRQFQRGCGIRKNCRESSYNGPTPKSP